MKKKSTPFQNKLMALLPIVIIFGAAIPQEPFAAAKSPSHSHMSPAWPILGSPMEKTAWPSPAWPTTMDTDTTAIILREVVLYPVDASGHESIAADLLYVNGRYEISYEGKRYQITPYLEDDITYDSQVAVQDVTYKCRLRLRAYER